MGTLEHDKLLLMQPLAHEVIADLKSRRDGLINGIVNLESKLKDSRTRLNYIDNALVALHLIYGVDGKT